MEFGQTDNFESIDFSFPSDDQRNIESFKIRRREHFLYGLPVWGEGQWKGKIYPSTANTKDFLSQYAKIYNCVELNSSYYHLPTQDMISNWKEQVANCGHEFYFCPKWPQLISHHKMLANTKPEMLEFCNLIANFSDNLGRSFLQLPQNFSIDFYRDLVKFVENIPKNFPVAIEFRHSTWFQEGKLLDKVYKLFQNNNIGTVITDVAGRRDLFHNSCPISALFIRFVGNRLHSTDEQRLDLWSAKIKEWRGLGLKEVIMFLHQPDNIHAPELSDIFTDKINDKMDLRLPSPLKASGVEKQVDLFGGENG